MPIYLSILLALFAVKIYHTLVFFLFFLFCHQCFIWCLLNIWVERPCSLQQQNVAVMITETF